MESLLPRYEEFQINSLEKMKQRPKSHVLWGKLKASIDMTNFTPEEKQKLGDELNQIHISSGCSKMHL